MEYLLLSVSALSASAKTLLSKLCEKKRIHLFNALVFGVAFLVLLALNIGKSFEISFYTVLIAVLYAAFTLGAQLFTIKAVQLGDVSVTSLIYYCGFIIPTVFSAIVWKEDFGIFKCLGLALVVLSFVLTVDKKEKKGGLTWLFTALFAMLCSGLIGIVQKVFSKSEHSCELKMMLCLAFGMLAVVCLVLFFATKSKIAEIEKSANQTKETVAAIGMGIATATANSINTYLSGMMPGIVFFPAVNGGSILLGMVGGKVFFKEKLSLRKVLAIGIGILAIVLLVI